MGEKLKELERVRNKGFKALKENLSPTELIEFFQIISDGNGDYTEERREKLKDLKEEDFEKYLKENN